MNTIDTFARRKGVGNSGRFARQGTMVLLANTQYVPNAQIIRLVDLTALRR
jgi:hypothetical protein